MRVALALGGARCVWDDANAAEALGPIAGVVAANDAGAAWPGRLAAFVTCHAEHLEHWLMERRQAGLPKPDRLYHSEAWQVVSGARMVEHRLPGQKAPGSSGLFAVKVALLDCNFDRVICCGIPMDAEEAHFFEPGKQWARAGYFRRGWEEVRPEYAARIRSMSGWTRDRFGAPDAAWFECH